MKHDREVRDRVGRLLAAPGRRGRQKETAVLYERSPRAMRDWTAKAGTPRRPVGRPRRSVAERAEAMRKVELEAARRERPPSWRTAHRVLGIPARLAQETVRTFGASGSRVGSTRRAKARFEGLEEYRAALGVPPSPVRGPLRPSSGPQASPICLPLKEVWQ